MEPELKRQEASIVVVGSFNPTIFNPDWLYRHDLISQADIEGANVELIHRDISKFSTSWFAIDVLQDRFLARTNDESCFLLLRDLIVSIFSILNQTPVKQMGMNINFDLSFRDEGLWHKLGDTLAPKDIWNKSLPSRVGLITLTVKCPRTDQFKGNLRISIESIRHEDIKFGIRFGTNSHVELNNEVTVEHVLLTSWEDSLAHAKQTKDAVIQEAIS